MTEFCKGDRVRLPAVEAVVDAAVPGGRVFIDGEWYNPDDLTLIERPAPPLPTEPGTTGTATVRGVPGVRVMRTRQDESTGPRLWVSERYVGSYFWHADSDLADFVPDPMFKADMEPETSPAYSPVSQDAKPAESGNPCECGHGRDEHGAALGCITQLALCPCTAYRPAPSPQPEPAGLVERVQAACPDALGMHLPDRHARAAALAVADWLAEHPYRRGPASEAIRREVEGGGK